MVSLNSNKWKGAAKSLGKASVSAMFRAAVCSLFSLQPIKQYLVVNHCSKMWENSLLGWIWSPGKSNFMTAGTVPVPSGEDFFSDIAHDERGFLAFIAYWALEMKTNTVSFLFWVFVWWSFLYQLSTKKLRFLLPFMIWLCSLEYINI